MADETPQSVKATVSTNDVSASQTASFQPLIARLGGTNLPDFDDIALGGISLRGVLTFTLLGALIILTGLKIVEPQYIVALTLTSMGHYFKK